VATITLKNVPDELAETLKRSARTEHRSATQQALVELEQAVAVDDLDDIELLRELDAFVKERKADGEWWLPEDIEKWIEEGRR